MTLAASTPVTGADDLAGAVAELRARGLRLSAARRLVLEVLFAADRPISADELAGGLDGRLPPSDLASVYRNLETLERLGLVRHVHLGHGPGLYAPAGDVDREFVLCERCETVRPLDAEEAEAIRRAVLAFIGHEARFTHFPLVGVCARCRQEG